MNRHKELLIQRVTDPSVMAIADRLNSKKMIIDEMYNKIHETSTSQEKMRLLYKYIKSEVAKAEVYKVLKEKESFLVDDLETRLSLA